MENDKSLQLRIATGVICWSTTFVMGAITLRGKPFKIHCLRTEK